MLDLQDNDIKYKCMVSENIQKEFYKAYDTDYWLYKVKLLKNCHDNYGLVKAVIENDLSESTEEDYKRMMRTEIHFLCFQMIETLFELLFVITETDNKNLWSELSFSNWSKNYKKINELSKTSNLFTNKMDVEISGAKVNIPLLRWVFYFIYPSKMTDEEWEINLEKIKKLILFFAIKFSDRGEYNAYKHSMRFYNSKFSMTIGLTGSKKMYPIGSADDSIIFLEKKKGKYSRVDEVFRTVKPFDFEKDYNSCVILNALIKNIIETRKYSLLPELRGNNFDFFTFKDVDINKTIISNTGVTKSSFTI